MYQIKLGVIDDSECACFVIFDKEKKQVLGKSCVEILDPLLLKGDLSETPTLLLNLIEKTFLFIVEVQISDNLHFSPSYKVKNITDNVDLINKFKKAHSIQIVHIVITMLTTPVVCFQLQRHLQLLKGKKSNLRTMMNSKCWKMLLHQPSDYPRSQKIRRCKEIPQLARRSRLRMKLENLDTHVLESLLESI
ncbi:hypothetical protein Ahy_B04g072574 [Arachis hypogaea]|uniref:Replication factor A C-terminal domain-containing protein n=1 Tax=Arachis hypogaea TaxID=3818 RepID=A0A444ZN77_ARAHY|nr:hypothetical protein Ahy_B04g072574 [Arachis hypogaea]